MYISFEQSLAQLLTHHSPCKNAINEDIKCHHCGDACPDTSVHLESDKFFCYAAKQYMRSIGK